MEEAKPEVKRPFPQEQELAEKTSRLNVLRIALNILKVYALAKLLGEQEQLSAEKQRILQAAAIVHDTAIKYCKEHYNGDATMITTGTESLR